MKHDKHGRRIPKDPARDIPARRFWENIDTDAMEQALSEKPDKYEGLLNMLHDPAVAHLTIPRLMQNAGVSLHELQILYADHQRHMGLLKACTEVPQVMVDVFRNAKDKSIVCPRCEGDKVVERVKRITRGDTTFERVYKKKCPDCEGAGRVTVQGDKHAQDLVFESMKLIKQPGGPLMVMNQNFGETSTLDMKFEEMMKLTQSITAGKYDSST